MKDVLAFAAPHSTLQETVGVVVVTPEGRPRLDVLSLWEFLESQKQLHRSKWPTIIIFMNALPRNAANKLLRVKLGDRFDLEPVQDQHLSPLSRLFDGKCPKQGTALTVPIPITPVRPEIRKFIEEVTRPFIERIDGVTSVAITVVDSALGKDTIAAFVAPQSVDIAAINKTCQENLHRYLCPSFIQACKSLEFPLAGDSGKLSVADYALTVIREECSKTITNSSSPLEKEIEQVWSKELQIGIISKTSNFFALGGDSLLAGRLVSVIRKEYDIPLTVADLFSFPTVETFALRVTELREKRDQYGDCSFDDLEELEIESHMLNSNDMSLLLPGNSISGLGKSTPSPTSPPSLDVDASSSFDQTEYIDQPDYEYRMKYSNTNLSTLLTQIQPLLLFFPLRRLAMWFVIAWSWLILMKGGVRRFPALLSAILVAHLVRGFVLPLIGVLCKWLIIGKYQAGRYPLFGAMYLKWWTVEQLLQILGRGYFGDEYFPFFEESILIRWYYVMMGM